MYVAILNNFKHSAIYQSLFVIEIANEHVLAESTMLHDGVRVTMLSREVVSHNTTVCVTIVTVIVATVCDDG